MLFDIIILVAILVILIFATREVLFFTRRRDRYKLRRLTLRLSMAAMLLFLLGSVFVGIRYFGLANPVGFDRLWIAFWAFIGMLTIAIFCLVLADLSAVGEETVTDTTDLLREMAQIIASHQQKMPLPKKESTDGDT